MITFRKHRFAFMLMSLSTIFVALAPLFLIASCRPLQQSPAELKARETLRSMTRGGVLPAEDAVARIAKRLSEHDCRFSWPAWSMRESD